MSQRESVAFDEARSAAPAPRPRVLVIEDTAEVRRAVVRSLKSLHVDVIAVATGEEGLREAQDELGLDLVITDVNLPGVDGFEVLSTLRADATTATTPVVLMTAQDDRASVRRGMGMGADDYLTKPFTAEEIRDTVRARLEMSSRLHRVFAQRLERTRAEYQAAIQEDPETGLPNRRAFQERLGKPKPGARGAVTVVEIDNFDRLQSAFYPNRVDLLSRVVTDTAERIRATTIDGTTVYRIGVARFAVVAEGIETGEAARELIEKMAAALRAPIGDEEIELRVTASLGVALWPGHGDSLADAATHAETAAYHARQTGGNHGAVFEPELHDQAINRLVLESGLHRALERNQFELFYQPQVNAETNRLVGVEALIRWNHPELGMVSPFHFIPIAEETGLIADIGAWVIEDACRQAARWSPELPHLKVAVNLSAVQLQNGRGLVSIVDNALSRSGLEAELLKLELTESMMVQAGEQAAAALRCLRTSGVGISIDDFGTGYSSLQNLRSFPVTEVKIDRSFVRRVPQDRDHSSIVKAVIDMAHQLGLRVVAEGVEEPEQLEFLRAESCDQIQGYLYSKPLPAHEFLRWARGFAQAA